MAQKWWGYSAARWANGDPSIEIEPYDYSIEGLAKQVAHLCGQFQRDRVVAGLDVYFYEAIDGSGNTLAFHMDNYTFSVACSSEDVRDFHLAQLLRPQLKREIRRLLNAEGTFASLREVAVEAKAAGLSRGEALAALEQMRSELTSTEEDTVLELMDQVSGFCQKGDEIY